MKVLFLTPYPTGEAPSQRFRFEQYFKLLEKNGIEFQTQSFWDIKTWRILYKSGHSGSKLLGFVRGFARRTRMLMYARSFDFVFIHRECMPIGPPVFEWALAKVIGCKLIYDFDDAIWLPNTSHENRFVAFLKCHSKVSSICAWSWRVSCGNDFLADYARQFNKIVVVNPTTIDMERHDPAKVGMKNQNGQLTIGWTGTHSTIQYLHIIVPAIRSLQKEFEVNFLVISDKNPKLDLQHSQFIPWREESEIEDLARIDIGIMPLSDDIWTKGKCGLKALQYMSMKIPCLVSPVGVNTTLIEHTSTGFLCKDLDDWKRYLTELLTQKTLRDTIGENARTQVSRHYSVESNAENFFSLFSFSR